MNTNEANLDSDPFISLGQLLTGTREHSPQPVSPGVIATVIENSGIQGWDRYGRFIRFTAQDEGEKAAHYREALDAVASEARYEWDSQDDQYHDRSPAEIEVDVGSSVFNRYGWQQSELPNFVQVEASQPVSPPLPSRSKRRENANALLVGVMKLLLVEDRLRKDFELDTAQPPYSSQTDLIGAITDIAKQNKLPGLACSTLEQKLGDANEALRARRA
ncbi:MAG: hypothetical protein ING90_20210 [Rhodocyclaceae bacterium]|nr:hypothetical protein [Rhodocyclaceae bacterium]